MRRRCTCAPAGQLSGKVQLSGTYEIVHCGIASASHRIHILLSLQLPTPTYLTIPACPLLHCRYFRPAALHLPTAPTMSPTPLAPSPASTPHTTPTRCPRVRLQLRSGFSPLEVSALWSDWWRTGEPTSDWGLFWSSLYAGGCMLPLSFARTCLDSLPEFLVVMKRTKDTLPQWLIPHRHIIYPSTHKCSLPYWPTLLSSALIFPQVKHHHATRLQAVEADPFPRLLCWASSRPHHLTCLVLWHPGLHDTGENSFALKGGLYLFLMFSGLGQGMS